MNLVYLGIGSNLRDKRLNIEKSIDLISDFSEVIFVSSFLKNPPLVKFEQDLYFDFLNCVVKIKTNLTPLELLAKIKLIESGIDKLKTKNDNKLWRPRKIDIDILLFNNDEINEKDLIIPHYEILKRDFFLTPLLQIDNNVKIKNLKLTDVRRSITRKLPIIFSIINFTPDSFSDGGDFFNEVAFRKKIKNEIKNISHVIDIGCCSTRPSCNNLLISEKEEIARFAKILPILKDEYGKSKFKHSLPKISIDSFRSGVVKFILNSGIKIDYINDVSGLSDTGMLPILKVNPDIKIIIMHNLGLPASDDKTFSEDVDIVLKINEWLEEKINFLQKNGIEKSQIIFDFGIGFGKKSHQNIKLLKEIDKFFYHGVQILIGHSRKSFMQKIFKTKSIHELDLITISMASFLNRAGCDVIRVHNSKATNDCIFAENFLY